MTRATTAMGRRAPGRGAAAARIAVVVLLAAGGAGVAAADEQMQEVRWRLPADSPRVDGFRVYVDTTPTGGAIQFEGPVAPGADGVYSVAVPVTVGDTIYVRVTAYNSAGESSPSATDQYDLALPPDYQPLGAPGQPQVVP